MMTSDYIQEDHHNQHHHSNHNSHHGEKIPNSDILFSPTTTSFLISPSEESSSLNNEFTKTKSPQNGLISNDSFLELMGDYGLTPDFFHPQTLEHTQSFAASNFQVLSPSNETNSFDFSYSSNECLSSSQSAGSSYLPIASQQFLSSSTSYYPTVNSQDLMWTSFKISNNLIHNSPPPISSPSLTSFSSASHHNTTHANSIKGKSPFVIMWLQTHFEPFEGVSMPRSLLYTHYYESCLTNAIEPVNAASFGKIIRSVFPNLRTRRLGTRGHSKYHYYGIRMKSTTANSEILPNFGSWLSSSSTLSSPYGVNFSCNSKLHSKASPEAKMSPVFYPLSYPTTSRVCSSNLNQNPNFVSCVTTIPPSIDKFASMLLKTMSVYLEEIQIENLDFFKFALQHHTTLLLSLILREEFFQFEEEFSLYWLTIFPKTFPGFFSSQKDEQTSKYFNLISTIRQFDLLSFNVIHDCFLSSFWIFGISAFQLENISLFCSKTLPALITILMKGYLGDNSIQFDSNGWPICKENSKIFPLKLISIKLENFKRLSSLLLKRISLCSLSTSLSASFVSLNAIVNDNVSPEQHASDSHQILKNDIKLLINEIRLEVCKQISKDEKLAVIDSSSYSFDNMIPLVIPEDILSYLIDSIEALFFTSSENQNSPLDWECWSAYLSSVIDMETGIDCHVEDDLENNSHIIRRKNIQQHQVFIADMNGDGLNSIENSIQRFLIQWSFVTSIFMDQLSKRETFFQPTLSYLKSSNEVAGDDLFSKYVHFDSHSEYKSKESSYTEHKHKGASPHIKEPKGASGAILKLGEIELNFSVMKTVLETLHMLTEEYLLYLVEKRLDEAKESLNVRLTSILSENKSSQLAAQNKFNRIERKKLRKLADNSADNKEYPLNTENLHVELSNPLSLAISLPQSQTLLN